MNAEERKEVEKYDRESKENLYCMDFRKYLRNEDILKIKKMLEDFNCDRSSNSDFETKEKTIAKEKEIIDEIFVVVYLREGVMRREKKR